MNAVFKLIFLCLLSLLLIQVGAACCAVAADEVTDGKNALENATDFPWYDAQNDAFKQVPLQQSKTPGSTNRTSNWQQTPATPTTRTGPAAGTAGNQSVVGKGISGMFWVIVGLILTAVVGLLIWAFLRIENEDTSKVRELIGRRNENDEERIENLPFDVRRTLGTMYDEAKHAYESGNYREAIIYLFSHMLIQMDRDHWIHLEKAKTNGQYLVEVRQNRQLKNVFHRTLVAFEDVFFGQRDIDKQRFESCWNSLPEFDSSLKQPAEAR